MQTLKKHWASTGFDFSQPTRTPSRLSTFYSTRQPQNTSNTSICLGIPRSHIPILAQREETREALRQDVSHPPDLSLLRTRTQSRAEGLGVVNPVPGRAQLRRHGAGHSLAEALTPHTARGHQEHHGVHQSFNNERPPVSKTSFGQIRWDGANMSSEGSCEVNCK